MTPRLFALGRRKKRAKLAAIADAARYYDRPADCDGSECFHDDDVCVNLETRYATTEDALAAARVPRLEADVDRLLKRTAKLGDLELTVAEALGLSPATSTDDLIAAVARLTADRDAARRERDEMRQQRDLVRVELGLEHSKTEGALEAADRWMREASRPTIPADALNTRQLEADMSTAIANTGEAGAGYNDMASSAMHVALQHIRRTEPPKEQDIASTGRAPAVLKAYRELLGSIWLYIDWRSVTRHLTTDQKNLFADAVDTSGDPNDREPRAERWWRDDFKEQP
jgi:hypothetical protein